MPTDDSKINPKKVNVPALDKALDILDFITSNQNPVSAATIARELGLARSTTHNLLLTLTNKGVLYKDNNNHLFSLGSYLLYWAGRFEERQGIISLFHECVVTFDELVPYTVTLSTIDFERGETVFLSSHQGSSVVDFVFRTGIRVPAVFSATGKAILSQLPFDHVTTIYKDGFPKPLTSQSVQNLASLKEELATIQNNRLSLDNGQLRVGMNCLGTYISKRGTDGRINLGIAISLSESEYLNKKDSIGRALIKLALMIENKLGLSNMS